MDQRSKEEGIARAASELPPQDTGTGDGVQKPSFWLRRDWLWGAVLLLAVILAYQPVWYAGYIWDDNDLLTANPCIVGPLGFKDIWTTGAADICPLTLSTFWLEHALWGLAPLPYHLVNVLLQGGCAILLWQVLRNLAVPGAWLGAALWALHPVQVESVAWITEMKNTESGFFYLLSILFFLRWLRAGDLKGLGRVWSYTLTLLFAALAMASKSSTVILPVVLCLCAWWMEGRWQWRTMVRVTPIFLMSIAASALSIWTQGLQLTVVADPQWVRTWPQRLIAAGDTIWFYLGKLLWPHPLITIYPRWQIDAGQLFSYLPLLAVINVLSILWLNRMTWSRPWFFVSAYFLVALAPVLGFVDNAIFRYSLVFDHFQYLASMGPLALVGAGFARLSGLAVPNPVLRSSLCAALLLLLAVASWQRVWVYQSEQTLWTDAIAKNPSCWPGYNNLGLALSRQGRDDEAIPLFQKAFEINPLYAEAHNNLGNSFRYKGQTGDAKAQYEEALALDPHLADAHNGLGCCLEDQGQLDDAISQFQAALTLNPLHADAHFNLGSTLEQKSQFDEAMAEYQKAIDISPNYTDARGNLGVAYLRKGEVDEAVAQFQKILAIHPNDARARNNLGTAFFNMGRMPEAIEQFREAVRLNPNDSNAQLNLAKAQEMAGSPPK